MSASPESTVTQGNHLFNPSMDVSAGSDDHVSTLIPLPLAISIIRNRKPAALSDVSDDAVMAHTSGHAESTTSQQTADVLAATTFRRFPDLDLGLCLRCRWSGNLASVLRRQLFQPDG